MHNLRSAKEHGELLVTGSGEAVILEQLKHLRHHGNEYPPVVRAWFKPEEGGYASCIPVEHDRLGYELLIRPAKHRRDYTTLELVIRWQVHTHRTLVWGIW
jgi:hypothetical protein